jgi:hypothetical protein
VLDCSTKSVSGQDPTPTLKYDHCSVLHTGSELLTRTYLKIVGLIHRGSRLPDRGTHAAEHGAERPARGQFCPNGIFARAGQRRRSVTRGRTSVTCADAGEVREAMNKSPHVCARARVGERPVSS